MNKISKVINKVIGEKKTSSLEMVKLYGKAGNQTYDEIGKKFNKSKQAAEVAIRTTCEKIHKNEEAKKILDSILLSPKGKHKYIDCRGVSATYPRLIAKIAGFAYGYSVSDHVFISTDKRIHLPKKMLLETIREKGLPVKIVSPKEGTGEMNKNSFLYCLSKDHWITDKQGRAIIGNIKSTLFYNACLFQKERTLSFFDILKLYADNGLTEYLEKNYALDMHKVNLKISRTLVNAKRLGKECEFGMAQRQNASIFGFAIYDFKEWLKKNGAYSENGDTPSDNKGILLLNKKVQEAEKAVKKMNKAASK